MDRFEPIKQLGEGSFGSVFMAKNKKTNEVVAVKMLKRKFYSWDECMNLSEVKSLFKLKHPNIVTLKELILEEHGLYFVFEYMECTLDQKITDKKTVWSEAKIRNWCYQVLQALAYMHGCGYFHRDLKPDNLLVTKEVIKVADFGLARELRSPPPYSEYVTTRWYRAPEVLLKSTCYNAAIDMWSMGAIMAELFIRRPFFPGKSQVDQLYQISAVLGPPNLTNWSDGLEIAASLNFRFPSGRPSRDISVLLPTASPEATDLISALCSWDPKKRPTALQALGHPFFQAGVTIPPSTSSRTGLVQQKTLIPQVPDLRASPQTEVHEQSDGGDSLWDGVLPTSQEFDHCICKY